ncbi:MAG: Holliday junction branch migration DNA helicase RuvB [Pseudomonadota bacterium]|nr:Holliday junction branch migration DNA helicase RuvB [Pseudomonadota bacterium]
MIEEERLITAQPLTPEQTSEYAMRPTSLEAYVGQNKIKNQLSAAISAAKTRGESLDHTLLFGPPGLGKTTLAHIIANTMGSQIKKTSGPAIDKAGDLAALLTNLQPHDVLFIDEIHRLSPHLEEILYPAMEDFNIDIMIGEGSTARSVSLTLPPFTLVAATTRSGSLTSPLRDRFGILLRLEFYNQDDLAHMIHKNCTKLNIEINDDAALEIAKRSRGTPRIANRLLRRTRDYAQLAERTCIDINTAKIALKALDIDDYGLDHMDWHLLNNISIHFSGGPVGLETLSANLGEEKQTIEDVIEPYLIQQGFIQRTARGRVITEKAKLYLHNNIRNL